MVVENGSRIENGENVFGFDGRLAIVHANDDARHTLLPEGNEDAATNHRLHFSGEMVGEGGVQRDRQSNVAEFRHGRPASPAKKS